MILRRETSPWLGVASGFLVIEALSDYLARGTVDFDTLWLVLVGVTLAVYVIVKVLKKTTSLLDTKNKVSSSTPEAPAAALPSDALRR